MRGDQFEQRDRRLTFGLNLSHSWFQPGVGLDSQNTLGLQLQNDNIFNGLLSTQARRVVSTTRLDHVVERSVGVYAENATRWLPWFRTVIGVRGDTYRFDVDSDNDANSGNRTAGIVNPKLALIFGPWSRTEFYINAGGGFHSNDATRHHHQTRPEIGRSSGPGVATGAIKGL